jgi:hypothetical protein
VISAAEYSAYMEWGTKTLARVPAELSTYAAQFKGGGKGGDAKKMIYAWCARVGVPKELWYFVFLKIMRVGVRPQPYFFVHKPVIQNQLVNDLKQIIETPR